MLAVWAFTREPNTARKQGCHVTDSSTESVALSSLERRSLPADFVEGTPTHGGTWGRWSAAPPRSELEQLRHVDLEPCAELGHVGFGA